MLRPGVHETRDRRARAADSVRAGLRAGRGDQRRLGRPLQPASARLLRPPAAAGRPGLLRHHPLVHGLPDVLLPHVQRRHRLAVAARRLQAVPRVAGRGDRPCPPGHDAPTRSRRSGPPRRILGFDDEESCFGLQFGHGIGVGLYEPPMISRVHSFECPVELEEGMVFALETYCPATDGRSAARIEEEVVVTKDGNRDSDPLPRRGSARRRQDVRARRRRARARGPALGGMTRYRLIRREEIELEPALPEHSVGLTRKTLIGGETGATHTGLCSSSSRTATSTLTSTRSRPASTSSRATPSSTWTAAGSSSSRTHAAPSRSACRTPGARTSAHAGSRWRRRGREAPTSRRTRSFSAPPPTTSRSSSTCATRATATSSTSRRRTWTSTL